MNYKMNLVTAFFIFILSGNINGAISLDTTTINSYNHFTLSKEIKSSQNIDGSIFCVGSVIQVDDSANFAIPYIGNFSVNGDLIWEQSFPSFPSHSAVDAKISENNDILVILNKEDKSEFTVLKLNPLRDSIWCKSFNWNSNDIGLEIVNFSIDTISILGSSRSFDQYFKFFKLNMSQDGDSLSNKLYSRIGSLNQYNFQDSTILQIGDVTRSFSKHGILLSQKNIVFSLNTDSTYLEYGKSVSDYWPNHEYGFNIYPKSDSSFILLGCSGGYSSPRGLPLILEVNSNGDTINTYCKGISTSTNTEYYSQAFKISDGWIFGAVAKRTNSITANNSKLVIEKRDNNMNSIWTQEFNYTGSDYCFNVIETGLDSILLYGSGLNSDSIISFISITNNQMVNNSNITQKKQNHSINVIYQKENKYLRLSNISKFSELIIYNLKGQAIISKPLNPINKTNLINCIHLASGSYLAIIKSKGFKLKHCFTIN